MTNVPRSPEHNWLLCARIAGVMALLSYFAILGTYGTVAVAAYTVGVRALSFSWIPGTGFAAAVATLVGQALGRGSEASPYFAEAYALLSQDAWLVDAEPERLARLKELGGVE